MSVARAIETGDLAELPARRQEDWRWTDLRGLIRALPPRSEPGRPQGVSPFAALSGRELLVVNGRGPDHLALAAGERAVTTLRIVATAGAGAHAAGLGIDLGPRAELTLLESYEGEAEEYLAEFELDIRLGADAALERIVLADDAAAGVSVSSAHVALSPRARFRQTVVTFGGRRQRLQTHLAHPGAGASARLDGLYLLSGGRHADITTVVTHQGVGGATDQLVKGVVADQARGVFQGRITVQRGADQTEARMGHHALVLSDRAEVDAKPELEIYADDVACAHGNTIGALDEDALFYARARGIAEDEARALLTAAFLSEVLDRIEHAGARKRLRALVAARLEARR